MESIMTIKKPLFRLYDRKRRPSLPGWYNYQLGFYVQIFLIVIIGGVIMGGSLVSMIVYLFYRVFHSIFSLWQ